ncbi:TPA: ABC transporter ATP-binding protein [bacterium]|nr:ABC transporter ATP-binding protein [bacterium]
MSRGRHGNTRIVEKPNNFKESILKLVRFLKPYRKQLIVSSLLSIIATILNIVGPFFLGKITSQIQIDITNGDPINLQAISIIGIILVSLYSLSSLFFLSQSTVMSKVVQNMGKNLRTRINSKINNLPLSYFNSNSYGDVLSRVSNDVDMITDSLNKIVSRIISSITTLVSVIVIMLIISRTLTLITLIFVPLNFIFVGLIVKFSQRYFREQQMQLGEINDHIEEMYSGHSIIKIFNAQEEKIKDFDKINKKLYKSAWRSQFFAGLMFPIMRFVGNLSYLAISIYGGNLALKGKILIGDIQSFLIYVRRFNEPVSQIAELTGVLQSTAAAAERVFEFLEVEELEDEKHKTKVLEDVRGKVEFKNVTFGYTKGNKIIKDFSIVVKPGQKVALVGPTGAGKTTIVNLLMRFYEVDKGEILIDDVPTREITRENVSRLFSMVLQDTWLFKGTIRENIVYGEDNVSEQELERAYKAANVDHFIKSLPKGHNMELDENSNISQGQKQLITIARAMVKNAPMLILDEATSSVDTRTETLIQKAMDDLMKGKTSFIIAHRLSTIKNADLILVMKDGRIVEQGNHEELLKKGGFYSELYNAQFN